MQYLFISIVLLSSILPSYAGQKKAKDRTAVILEADQKGPVEILGTVLLDDSESSSNNSNEENNSCLSVISICLNNCPSDIIVSRNEGTCDCNCSESREGFNVGNGLEIDTRTERKLMK